ncbi:MULTISPECIES: glucosamine-6-phosphate deaminase [Spirulina sp. CCY15215]|uniref:glucosamine-6-phosphate deaminase n=1 Tax=Spirulina sp. CCY15215 TaxID=2767591 RepID=UPI0019504356|nr:glucosamine-6-phosphate deaminase [Spirulina major]
MMKRELQIDRLAIRVYENAEEMSTDAAKLAGDYLRSRISRQRRARVIWATGSSQIRFLEGLTALQGIEWEKVTSFHLDEYLGIEGEHPASFRHYLRDRLAQKVSFANFHYLEGDSEQPVAECDRYTRLLQAGAIDLCCLGVGENGHLAFNDPGVAEFNDPYWVKLVKLDAKNRQQQCDRGYFAALDKVPAYAFTLTLPAISAAQKLFCLVPGQQKAAIVKQMLEGAIDTNCPASWLRDRANAILFLDRESARLL